jgi:hypothetical protein
MLKFCYFFKNRKQKIKKKLKLNEKVGSENV